MSIPRKGWGKCKVCELQAPLKSNGTVDTHWYIRNGKEVPCLGSSQPPKTGWK